VITIRKYKPDDTYSIIKIAFSSLPESYNPNVFNYFYETYPEGFIVAERYHKIIGFIAGIKISKKTVKIPMLAISEKHRRQGLGSVLLTKFFEEIKNQKIKKAELEVRTTNKAAIAFYEKHGFKITQKVIGFYQNGEDAFIMEKLF
jgi:ribosomal-protein-alanine N-acetyltransferase